MIRGQRRHPCKFIRLRLKDASEIGTAHQFAAVAPASSGAARM